MFGGSRFIFRALAPVLLCCGVALPFLVAKWDASRVIFVSLAEAFLLSLILALYDPLRFRWAARCVTGVVFCAYLMYVVDEVLLGGKGAGVGSGVRSGPSPTRAVAGFVAIGLPCLWYTIFGRFSLRGGDEGPAGGPEHSDKVDAVDLDI